MENMEYMEELSKELTVKPKKKKLLIIIALSAILLIGIIILVVYLTTKGNNEIGTNGQNNNDSQNSQSNENNKNKDNDNDESNENNKNEEDDEDDSFIEKEQPELNEETKLLISKYKKDPSEENYLNLRNAVINNYNAVLIRKENKLNELRIQTAGKPGGEEKVAEMEEIVQDMYITYWNRINSNMLRFTDDRLLKWVISKASQYEYIPVMGAGETIFIKRTPVTNSEYYKFVKEKDINFLQIG